MSAVLPIPGNAQTLLEQFTTAGAEGVGVNFNRYLDLIGYQDGEPIELQALDAPSGRFKNSLVAYAFDRPAAAKLLTEADKLNAVGVYAILNCIDPQVATRYQRNTWCPMMKGVATTDSDITHRRVLFFDFDVRRPRNTSATDAQTTDALAVTAAARARIGQVISPNAIGSALTGNGGALFVAIEPTEETPAVAMLVRGVLAAGSALFSTPTVELDTSVCEPKRLGPAMGTTKRKGAPGNAAYPHRRSAIQIPQHCERVGVADLEMLLANLRLDLTDEQNAVVDKAMGKKASKSSASSPSGTASATTSASNGNPDSPFTRANACAVGEVLRKLGRDPNELVCPGCESSGDSSVALVANGFKCSHARCATKGRNGFRTPVDLVAEVNGCKPIEAVRWLADAFGFEVDVKSTKAQEPAPPTSAPVTWKSTTDRARILGGAGLRLTTGWSTLDKATRGGIPVGKVIVVAGAPGAGKTTGVVQLAVSWARQGIAVAILAADEEADGLLIRIGQVCGLNRELLEAGDPGTRVALVAALEALPTLQLIDADEEQLTFEQVSAELEKQRGEAPSVLVIDSIQTVPVFGMETADGPRARTDLVTAAMKREAKTRKHLVVATCEMPRGAYRSQNASERIDDLAAFKESGSIEYGASVALVMRSVPGDGGLVDVTMPKNRLGTKAGFRLALDGVRASFTEVQSPSEGASSAVQSMKDKIVRAVAKSIQPITSKSELQRRAKGNRATVIKAVDEMLEEGELEYVAKAFRLPVPTRSETVPRTALPDEPFHRSRPIGAERVTGTGMEAENVKAE